MKERDKERMRAGEKRGSRKRKGQGKDASRKGEGAEDDREQLKRQGAGKEREQEKRGSQKGVNKR